MTSVTEKSVLARLCDLSPRSSLDVLNMDSKLLRIGSLEIVKPLTHVINVSINEGHVHEDWKLARVTPVYKGSGSRDAETNYRPISNIAYIAKIIEKEVHCQLSGYLKEHDFISPDQSAYLAQHSTQTSLHRVYDDWLEALNDGLSVSACFLDISKCFDSINHTILLHKLKRYGIRNMEYSWFKSYLSNRKLMVRLNNSMSEAQELKIGVPQGSILGPILFLLYENDLSSWVHPGLANLYADDALLYAYGNSLKESSSNLQYSVNSASSWYEGNRLGLNGKKCECMNITYKLDKDHNVISINGNIINETDSTKYLGLMFDNDLSFKEHVNYITNKCKGRLVVLRRLKSYLGKDTLKKIYKICIEPIMDYCSTVWGQSSKSNRDQMQRIQNTAGRIIAGNFDCINYRGSEIINNLGWQSFDVRLRYYTAVLSYKAVHNLVPNYLSDLLTFQCDVHDYPTRSAQSDLLNVPDFRISKYKESFKYNSAILWNSLPIELRHLSNVTQFKKGYKELYYR